MTLWRRRFAGKQRGVYRPLQHAQYSGQTKTHHLILFYAEYLWSLNLHLAGWIAGLKEKLSANSFLVQCVCCAWFPRIFQLAYPFPNFSDLVTFSNLMSACRRSGFTKPGFSIMRVLSQTWRGIWFSRSLLFQLGAPMELQVASLEILWEKHGQPGILRAFPGRARAEAFWVSEHGISQFNIVSDIVQDMNL